METKDWITAGIAAYAAILSTYNIISEAIRERSMLRVRLIPSRELIITNRGDRQVTILDVEVNTKSFWPLVKLSTDNRRRFGMSIYGSAFKLDLPLVVTAGETIFGHIKPEIRDEFFQPFYDLKGLKKIRLIVTVTDSEGKRHKGKIAKR